MNSTFFQFFSPEISQSITVYVFLTVIVLCFIKYILFKGDVESRGVQKIIGGLAVFVVALLSQDWRALTVSLFIGGLIIASEEFMEKLVIILKSKSPDIGKNLETTKATKKEIKEKQEAEVAELKKNIEKTSKKKVQKSALLRTVVLAESLVADYFKERVGDRFGEDAKFDGTNIIADGIITNEFNTIIRIVEIKHMPSLDNALDIVKYRTNEIKKEISTTPIIFCIVLDNKPLKSEIEKFEKQTKIFDNVEIGIFYIKSDRLIPIIEPKL